jgi:DNA-binding transcriptional MerR regulator
MATPTNVWLAEAPAAGAELRLTVEEFAREVGMSTRNIRAHQARGLLPAPKYEGRRAYYDGMHVKRARMIQDLQRGGFNLVAIKSMMVDAGADTRRESLLRIVQHVRMAAPAVADRLAAHGVLAPDQDGSVRLHRAQVLQAALALRDVGVPTLAAIRLVADLLDEVHERTQELVGTTTRHAMTASAAGRTGDLTASPIENVLTLAVVETFRLVAENLTRTSVRALVDERVAPQVILDAELVLDVG